MTRKLVQLGPQLTLPDVANGSEFEPTDFWCAFVGELLRSNKGMGEVLAGVSPMLDGISSSLTTALSGLQIQGRDFAGLPKEVIAAHHRASTALGSAQQGLNVITALVKSDRAKLRDDMIRLAWAETQRMGNALIDLREELKVASRASTDEVEALERDAIRSAEREQVETARRAQAVPAAAAAAKAFLARQQADESAATHAKP